MTVSVTGMTIMGALYVKGLIPGWLCIVVNALLTLLLHELEHDLIHRLYFGKQPLAHNVMLLCWITRPGMPSPWLRRALYFHHHKESGAETDVEAWITTSGSPWEAKRLLKLVDGFIFGIVNALFAPTWREKIRLTLKVLRLNAPLGLLYWGCWYVFLGYHFYEWASSLAGITHEPSPSNVYVNDRSKQRSGYYHSAQYSPSVLPVLCQLKHSLFRRCHARNPLQHTQVMNSWWLWPFQLFCFNFGSTYCIRHFVVKNPFCLRQVTALFVHKVLAEVGVRFNDFGTCKR